MPTPGPIGRPRVSQMIRKIIQAICSTTAIGIMFEMRVPIAMSGIYFSCATERIIQMYGLIGVKQLPGESPRR